jgi:hypothetical protein
MIAEYPEHAMHFESMAADANDAKLKHTSLGPAGAYRNLADERARDCKIALPASQKIST